MRSKIFSMFASWVRQQMSWITSESVLNPASKGSAMALSAAPDPRRSLAAEARVDCLPIAERMEDSA